MSTNNPMIPDLVGVHMGRSVSDARRQIHRAAGTLAKERGYEEAIEYLEQKVESLETEKEVTERS